jgi:hypothetical protein
MICLPWEGGEQSVQDPLWKSTYIYKIAEGAFVG